MIGKITPLVEEAGRMTWVRAVALHWVGLAVSALMLGAVLSLLGSVVRLVVPPGPLVAAWALIVVGCGLSDLNLARLPLPPRIRQTPGAWKCVYGPEWSALLWGLDLGQGWTVRIPFAAYFVIAGWAIAAPHVPWAMAVIAGYGVGKGLPVAAARFIGRFVGNGRVPVTCLARRPATGMALGSASVLAGFFVLASLAR